MGAGANRLIVGTTGAFSKMMLERESLLGSGRRIR
jgi:hypothetical protein